MVRIPRLTVFSLVFAVACAACSSNKPGGAPGDPGGGPQPGDPMGPGTVSPGTSNERPEVSLGMTILARDAAGAPRLMRAIRPRAMPAGMTSVADPDTSDCAAVPVRSMGAPSGGMFTSGRSPSAGT